jgi:starch phosphorylase
MKSQTSAVHAGTALRPGAVRDAIIDRLGRSLGKSLTGATRRDIYDALTIAIREELAERWIATGTRVKRARVKRVCYLSMEFLLGRSLINALSSFEDELIEEVARS